MYDVNRRGFLALAGVAAAGVGLSACAGSGGSTSTASSGTSGSSGGTTTLEFWSNHPRKSKQIEADIIAAFEAKNPSIKVKLVDAGANYEEIQQKFNAALAGGQVPDALVVSDVTWFNFALNKQLEPVDDLMKSAGLDTGDYVGSLYADYQLNGKHFAVPYARSTPLFYYNKELWKKAGLADAGPKSWDEFAQWAAKLAPVMGSDKHVIGWPDGQNALEWYYQGVMWPFGGAYSKDWTCTFTDDNSLKAVDYLKKLFADKYAVLSKDPAAEFSAQTIACLVETTGSLGTLVKDAKFDFGTAFLPAPTGGSGCPTGGAGIAIPAKLSAERKAAAVRFIEFMTNTENTLKFAQGTGYMPVRTSALASDAEKKWLADNPKFKTALEQLPTTKPQDNVRVFAPGGGMKIGAALEKVAKGADSRATMEALQKDLQGVIDSQIKPKL